MIIDGISPSATLLDLIERSHNFELLNQWLIFGNSGQGRGVMLLIADYDVTH
jgi:hypothetical protein